MVRIEVIQAVGIGLTIVTAVLTAWNRLVIAELLLKLSQLETRLVRDQEDRCEKCREQFIPRGELTQIDRRLINLERQTHFAKQET